MQLLQFPPSRRKWRAYFYPPPPPSRHLPIRKSDFSSSASLLHSSKATILLLPSWFVERSQSIFPRKATRHQRSSEERRCKRAPTFFSPPPSWTRQREAETSFSTVVEIVRSVPPPSGGEQLSPCSIQAMTVYCHTRAAWNVAYSRERMAGNEWRVCVPQLYELRLSHSTGGTIPFVDGWQRNPAIRLLFRSVRFFFFFLFERRWWDSAEIIDEFSSRGNDLIYQRAIYGLIISSHSENVEIQLEFVKCIEFFCIYFIYY